MSLFQSSGDGGAAQLEAQRQNNITSGEAQVDQSFSKFDPTFFQNYQNTILGAETPQLMDQYRTTGKNLTYALARGGNMNGSVGQQENQSLNNQLAVNQSTLANKAADASNQLQGQVQTQKGQLYSQLEQGGTPSTIAESAAAQASQDRAPSAIQPLGNLFSDWAGQYINNQTTNAYQQQNPLAGLLNETYGVAQ
jgi:hypothetical protein